MGIRGLAATVVSCLLAAAACSSPSVDQPAASGSPTSTSATEASPAPSTSAPGSSPSTDGDGETDGDGAPAETDRSPDMADALADLDGQLALGSGPALAVARPDGRSLRLLAGDDEVASQPTWSGDGGSLAWSSSSNDGSSVQVQVFDDQGLPGGEPLISPSPGFVVFYLQWDGSDQRLAALRNSDQTLGAVELGLIQPGRPLVTLDVGAPYFVAWAPDSDRLLAHIDGESIELFDPVAADVEPTLVVDQGGAFSAPFWIDEERALVVADGALSVLSVPDGTIEIVEPVDGNLRFVVSPDRRRVAYRQLSPVDDGTLQAAWPRPVTQRALSGELIVLDLEDGDRQVVDDRGALAWEWSPDGTRLAWLTTEADGRPIGRWSFWSAEGPEPVVERTPDFVFSRKYIQTYLAFFVQYTLSVTGWSPDGSAFAFPGSVGERSGVWIQLLDRRGPAQLVADGDFVTWGPGPTPPPESSGPSSL